MKNNILIIIFFAISYIAKAQKVCQIDTIEGIFFYVETGGTYRTDLLAYDTVSTHFYTRYEKGVYGFDINPYASKVFNDCYNGKGEDIGTNAENYRMENFYNSELKSAKTFKVINLHYKILKVKMVVQYLGVTQLVIPHHPDNKFCRTVFQLFVPFFYIKELLYVSSKLD